MHTALAPHPRTRTRMLRPRFFQATASLLLLSCLPSCIAIHKWQKGRAQQHREIELADVAKSWSQTIRASQVIPVYPLTEDLQPGDVFLVTRTIEDQAAEYKRDGFLPLDQHLLRFQPAGYDAFYSHSHLAGEEGKERLPARWMRPSSEDPPQATPWSEAPGAAFPTYSFQVKSGAGFNLALPLKGVPVGLSLLSDGAAHGTVTISDARTLGVDMLSLWDQLRALENLAPSLAEYGAVPDRPVYLRVVTRVYLAGAIDVSIASHTDFGAGADVRTPSPVDLLTRHAKEDGSTRPATAEEFESALERLNEGLEERLGETGGSVRVVLAAGNTVSLKEKLDPPLVIGYLGFDCLILPGGGLSPPVPTLTTLTHPQVAQQFLRENVLAAIYDASALDHSIQLLRSLLEQESLPRALAQSGRAVLESLDGLGAEIDAEMPTYGRHPRAEDWALQLRAAGSLHPVTSGSGYDRFRSYRSRIKESIAQLRSALEEGTFRIEDASASAAVQQIEGEQAVRLAAEHLPRLLREQERLEEVRVREQAALRSLRAWNHRFWSL